MSAVVAPPTTLTLHLAADARQRRKERFLAGYLARKGIRIPVHEHAEPLNCTKKKDNLHVVS